MWLLASAASPLDSALEQFFGRWLMIEDGDRHHDAQSACLEHGIHGIRNAHNHVVIVFVLHNDIDKLGAGLACQGPSNHGPSEENPCNLNLLGFHGVRIGSATAGLCLPPGTRGRIGDRPLFSTSSVASPSTCSTIV